MDEARPLVYLVYGLPKSGRRKIIFDLIEGGIPLNEKVLYFQPENTATCSFDEQIVTLKNIEVLPWKLEKSKITHGKISAAPEKIIFLAPDASDPADCAEALKSWADHNQCQVARLITVVNCSFLIKQPKALAWFEACIHFSDIVLLSRREGVENKWIKDFEDNYKKACYPARFLLVKKDRVTNPPEVLDPQARRRSLYFDELIPLEEDEFDDAEKPDDTKPDIYIHRLESGQRAKPIPDIKKLLNEIK